MSTPNSPSGGPPLRALAMVLIALAIVFAGIGAMSLSSSDSSDAEASSASSTTVASATVASATAAPAVSSSMPPVVATPPVSSAAPAATTPAATTPAPPTTTAHAGVDKSVPVRVFNNSMVAGLAAKTANDLSADGWNIAETGNYGAGVIPKTTVYYGSSAAEKAAAQAVAAQLGVGAEPRFAGIMDSPPGVIVIVTGN
ncbi:LytR C-terminal domain-containing protein [Nocardia acidivorans]|uniref:LytR C-terminal domain-containing protein n=1 Tax=Nocardia acidivorans TaxID=404580 RepID=UPI0008353280|nr:LytR C-terminal domain-containing protein [Nocardia acidivorans]